LSDNIKLTELTKNIIKTITTADHEEKATISPRAITYIGSIIGSVILLLV
jgi:hypothetical protein